MYTIPTNLLPTSYQEELIYDKGRSLDFYNYGYSKEKVFDSNVSITIYIFTC